MRLAGLRGSCLVRDLALTASRRAERAGRLDQPSALQTRQIAGLRRPRRLTSRRIKVLWNSLGTPDPFNPRHARPAALPSILDREDLHDGLRAGMGG
jgi:hypothetical protein